MPSKTFSNLAAAFRAAAVGAVVAAESAMDEATIAASLARVVWELIDDSDRHRNLAQVQAQTATWSSSTGLGGGSEPEVPSQQRVPDCLSMEDLRACDVTPLQLIIALHVDAVNSLLQRFDRRSQPRRGSMSKSGSWSVQLGLNERLRFREQTSDFRNRHDETQQTQAHRRSGAAVQIVDEEAPGQSGDAPEATTRPSTTATLRDAWRHHDVGAEIAVEVIAILRMLGPAAVTGHTVTRLVAVCFAHSTYVYARQAAAAAAGASAAGHRHPAVERYDAKRLAELTRGDVVEHMAFAAAGCDADDLSAWVTAFEEQLAPEELRDRLCEAESDLHRGGTALARRASFRSSRSGSRRGSSADGSEVEADDETHSHASRQQEERAADEADAEYYRRLRRAERLVVDFYFVLEELQRGDAAWAAWVPERSAVAAAQHHQTGGKSRQQ